MPRCTLGLDLGPNSIGWALIDEDNEEIVDLGVRVFPEGVDNFDTSKEVSRSEGRRNARGMRRGTKRRQRRRCRLRAGLAEAGLFPKDAQDQKVLLARDPYELRARALEEKLAPHDVGRVFFHLAQRRGFRSNRKKDRGDKEVQGMLAEINQLEAEMRATGSPTLGKLLHEKARELKHAGRLDGDQVRNRHTKREMYEQEFEAICEAQGRLGHGDLLSDELKYGAFGRQKYPWRPRLRPKHLSPLQAYGLHGLIFFQRRMYWPRSAVGACELEPKQPRCPRADRRAQRFRLLQEVNNLRYVDPVTREEQRLDAQQRTLLLDKLARQEKISFDQIRAALCFLESVKFNLEKGKRSYLSGMVVDVRMAKPLGKSWHDRAEEDKDAIVEMLIDNEREDDVAVQSLTDRFGMTQKQAEAALDVDFPAGHVQLSLKAIHRLLPHLERGLVYQSVSDPEQSALHAAGYLRRDELRRRLFDKLPDPRRVRDCPIGDLPNPVVKRTLVLLLCCDMIVPPFHNDPGRVHLARTGLRTPWGAGQTLTSLYPQLAKSARFDLHSLCPVRWESSAQILNRLDFLQQWRLAITWHPAVPLAAVPSSHRILGRGPGPPWLPLSGEWGSGTPGRSGRADSGAILCPENGTLYGTQNPGRTRLVSPHTDFYQDRAMVRGLPDLGFSSMLSY